LADITIAKLDAGTEAMSRFLQSRKINVEQKKQIVSASGGVAKATVNTAGPLQRPGSLFQKQLYELDFMGKYYQVCFVTFVLLVFV
jgi:hypothetical protein